MPAAYALPQTSSLPEDGMKACILLVDDEPQILKNFEKKHGIDKYRVLTAANGLEALGILRQQKVDIVVTDVMMPLIGGYELMHRIWDNIAIAQTPIIVLYSPACLAFDYTHQQEWFAKLSESHPVQFADKLKMLALPRKLVAIIDESLRLCNLYKPEKV